MVSRSLDPLPELYPPGYNLLFHEGSLGHDLESCVALKCRVQELVNSKVLTFMDIWPNVKNNPIHDMKSEA